METSKTKILIADDNAALCASLKDSLAVEGYLLESVRNGYELLSFLGKKSADIIILDMIMPDKDGMEVFSAIKSLAPSCKIIIYTGFEKYEHSVYSGLADKFLLKDNNPEQLIKTIKELDNSLS